MTRRLLRELDTAEWDIRVVFANTGQEHEETLRFVQRCDEYLGFETTWIEAVFDPRKGRGTRARVVDFATASRQGEPFEAYIAKHGIPNVKFPACTRDLKARAVTAHLRATGWRPRSYDTAIGIRADELDRALDEAARLDQRIVYPLLDWGVEKADVLEFWRRQNFDLYIPEHLGNCVWCWKKSLRKHLTLAVDHPEVFDFPAHMERLHPFAGPGRTGEPRRFFRGKMTVGEIFERARQPFEKYVDGNHRFDPDLDVGGSCGETCEIGADEGLAA